MNAGSATVPIRLAVRLLCVTDLHANLHPYDYFRDRADDSVGLARTASLIAEARGERRNCLLFDIGDTIQGTPLADWAAEESARDTNFHHPVIAAMNRLDFAAATFGNHEFDYGLDVLEKAYADAAFPIVCTNIRRGDGEAWFSPSLMLERRFADESGALRPLKVGVVGLAPPQIARWDEQHVAGRLMIDDMVAAAREEAAALRLRGADLVVALCHSGISRRVSGPNEEDAARDLAMVEGIDALLLGHQHLVFPGADFAGLAGLDAGRGTVADKPAVMAGVAGSHLGIIDLGLDWSDGGWHVASARAATRPVARRAADGAAVALVKSCPAVIAAAEDAHRATLDYIRAPVGALSATLHSYFAMIGDDPTVRLVNQAQGAAAKRLAAARLEFAGLPILSAAAPFKCGGRNGPEHYTDIARGPIAIKDIADLYPYPNSLRVVKVDGATLREWLERSASVFRRIDPDGIGEQPLLGASFVCYNFDVIDGLNYVIDVTEPARYDDAGLLVAPAARRIRGLTFGGAPLDPLQTFLVATSSYRASGGGGFPGCDGRSAAIAPAEGNRDALLRHIAAAGTIAPRPDGNWRLGAFPPSVVVTYLTSPKAAALPAPAGARLTALGPAPGGFLKFRVEPA